MVVGRNPKTGEEVLIDPRRVLTFRASHVLKSKINKWQACLTDIMRGQLSNV